MEMHAFERSINQKLYFGIQITTQSTVVLDNDKQNERATSH